MSSKRVRAAQLRIGDIVHLADLDGYWIITSLFVERADGVIDLDLLRVDDSDQASVHISSDARQSPRSA